MADFCLGEERKTGKRFYISFGKHTQLYKVRTTENKEILSSWVKNGEQWWGVKTIRNFFSPSLGKAKHVLHW
jgi:hypothetical protein